MFAESFAESFAQGHTWVHRLDARLRVAAAFGFSVLIAVCGHPLQAGISLALAFLLLCCSRPPLGPLFRRLALVNLFILFLWLVVPFSMSGPALFQLGPFCYSRSGAALMLLVSLKANAIGLLSLACVATMRADVFGHALAALCVPGKFVFLLLFTYRAIFLLAGEWQRLGRALKLHGFTPALNLHTYRTFGNLIGLTLVRGLERAERIRQAMLLRGFSGHFYSLAEFRFGGRDALFLALCLVLVLLYGLCP